MKVRWTLRALEDLRHLHEFISEENPQAASEMVSRIYEAAEERLAKHPKMGKVRRVSGTRELVMAGAPYIIIYLIEAYEIQIVSVLHSSLR